MQEFISLYNRHHVDIEKFLIETLRNNGQFMTNNEILLQRLFGILPSLELVYVTDAYFQQTSPNIYKSKFIHKQIGANREYLVTRVEQKEPHVYISTPYISSATGESCVTVMYEYLEENYFFDFNLTKLLSRFGVIERHPLFNAVSKIFYLTVGLSLMFFSIMSIGYAFYDYFVQLMTPSEYALESVFKPIVALTLGLAIFDLAKTLLEREVFFKAYSNRKDEFLLLSKFLIAIIIALSIEALMVVFKIALNDPSQMLHALYLIIGVVLIIVSLTIYSRWTKSIDD